jgi:hypothetical protein
MFFYTPEPWLTHYTSEDPIAKLWIVLEVDLYPLSCLIGWKSLATTQQLSFSRMGHGLCDIYFCCFSV